MPPDFVEVIILGPWGESLGYRSNGRWFRSIDGADKDVTNQVSGWRSIT